LSQVLADGRGTPAKGWVRDGILTVLAKGPATATDIARELGVSKATVSYHTKALIRREIIIIVDIKSIRGGVFSKTFALKQDGLPLARRRDQQEGAMSKLEELFERLLVNWHLEGTRKPSDEVEIFLYHLYRLLADSDALDAKVFESFGARSGQELISSSLGFKTMRGGLTALADYLNAQDMARVTAEIRKDREPRLVCLGCFENNRYGSLVCAFTKGMMTGAIKEKHGGRLRLDRMDQGHSAEGCVYEVKTRGFKD